MSARSPQPATALIAEDEAPQRRALHEQLLQAWPGLEIVEVCEDGVSALEAATTHRPTVAFLDIRPLFPGHVLLVPRDHHETLTDLPADLVGPLFERVQRLADAVPAAMGAAGTFVAVNNTVSQSVPHLHVHVVPRNPRDGLRGFFWPRTPYRDEAHVAENRRLYREKFESLVPMLQPVMQVSSPEAGFYLWARVPGGDDERFARELFAATNVTVLPGQYLARDAHGTNPGRGYVRMALVPGLSDCIEAARRIVAFCR